MLGQLRISGVILARWKVLITRAASGVGRSFANGALVLPDPGPVPTVPTVPKV